MMSISRVLRHLCTTRWSVGRVFPKSVLASIRQAIGDAEESHAGEIRFVVEAALDGLPLLKNQTARERAIELFSRLRVWDTQDNSGVLVYLLMADRRVEIVADRGIHANVGADGWSAVCRRMEAAFSTGDFEGGTLEGVRAIASLLARHCPSNGPHVNELPDAPVVL